MYHTKECLEGGYCDCAREIERMNMKTYEKFEEVEGLMPCMKKPLVVHAKRIDEPFKVYTLEHTEEPFQGKAGDYLMRGIEGELYVCDGNIFEKTYDFVDGEDE